MKRLLAPLYICLMLGFGFSSCGKDDNDPPSKSKSELLTQQTWKFSSATAGGFDVTGDVPACYKDNILTFNAAGTGNVNESADVCSPTTAGNFTWTFQNNESEINASTNFFPGGSGVFTLVSLTETTLVLAQNMTIPPFPTTNVQVTLVH